jgi:hypothetical protein
MRKRWLAVVFVVVATGVAGRAVSWAQKVPAGSPIEPPPQRWRSPSPNDAQVKPSAETLPPDLPSDLPPGPPPAKSVIPPENVVGDDPMGVVDSFLKRNRKETEDSIKALNLEAESLRARLQKVEAALARWQTISAALNQDATPDQTRLEPIPSAKADLAPTLAAPPPTPGATDPAKIPTEPAPSPPPAAGSFEPTPVTQPPGAPSPPG